MARLQVFDPPMCCSTGVCGPNVNPELPRFAADLDWLKKQGVQVERFNLAQQPAAFASNELVKCTLAEEGQNCLPLILVDGKIVSRCAYPTRQELMAFLEAAAQPAGESYTAIVEELVAIGASVAANCTPCLRYHCSKARALGVSDEDIARAVNTANSVKQASARHMLETADRLLNSQPEQPVEQPSCCGPKTDGSRSKCC